ncbi:polysaccharide biosynthesis tyrosine autokinase [Amnibacterium setariae]|uniref:polysaccharide biosynthesis tyrosine autokinase n=1 Tax=Amnibacterium setariae TaxID=2306585 RepID=UPI0013144FC7|nr:polysaccharide biosynthesis tyrosine autokinase [Amnibacterium setariae]
MDLHQFLRTVRRSWPVIVMVLAVFIIVGAAYTIVQRPSYSASATAYVSVSTNSSVNDLSQGADFVQQAVKSYAGVATSAYVLERVIDRLDLDESVGTLKEQVSAQAPVDTTLLDISATASSPTQAAAIANAVTTELSSAVDRLTLDARSSSSAVVLTRIDPATAPSTPSSPNVPLNLGIAAILGLAVGLGIAVLRDRLDTRIRDREEAGALVAAPVLGEILEDPRAASRPLVAVGGDDSPGAEAYRTLRTNLEFLDFDKRPRSIVVTSSIPREGKTLSVVNLAAVTAEAGHSVVVVDADLRRPQVGRYFGLEDRVGLTDVLLGTVRLDDAIQQWGGPQGPLVLPAGRIPPNPSELLQSEAMRELIEQLEARYDVVLIDTPPLVPVSDAAILTRRTGGALLLAASRRTRKADLRRAAANLAQVDGRLLGVVLTMVAGRDSAAYSYERAQLPAASEQPDDAERPRVRERARS